MFGRKMAGPVGFEPTHAGIKTRCLNRLATPQLSYSAHLLSICRFSINYNASNQALYAVDPSCDETLKAGEC